MKLNEDNFKTFYNQYKLIVYNVAINYVQNIEDAEEITQDVFVKAFQSYHKFNHISDVNTWLYRIAINTSLDFIRKKSAKKYLFVFGKKSLNDNEFNTISNFEHPGILLENQENAKIMFQAINSLTENQKTAFVLSKLEELNNTEIATIMNLSISAVEGLVFRAKQALQEKLSQEFKNYQKKK